MILRQCLYLVIAISVLALSRVTHAADTASGDELFADLGAFVHKTMTETAVPGAAVGVLYQGRQYTRGFGVTNVEHPLGVTADTLFQVGSITKTMTGTILMRLVEQGKLDPGARRLNLLIRLYEIPAATICDLVLLVPNGERGLISG